MVSIRAQDAGGGELLADGSRNGETSVVGSDAFDGPAWHWPKR